MQVGHHTVMDPSSVRPWEGHVIVRGLQGIGLRMVEQLHQAGKEVVEVVVVDDEPDQRLVRMAEAWDIPYIVGGPRIAGILERAGLSTARAVVCAERTEVQTWATALLISELRPDVRVVVQLANAAVGTAVSQVTGPDTVLDVAAPCFVGAALGLDILGSFTVGRQPFLVGRLTVAPGRGLDGLAMQDLLAPPTRGRRGMTG
jgi:voltage-gated potassium channel Kch